MEIFPMCTDEKTCDETQTNNEKMELVQSLQKAGLMATLTFEQRKSLLSDFVRDYMIAPAKALETDLIDIAKNPDDEADAYSEIEFYSLLMKLERHAANLKKIIGMVVVKGELPVRKEA